VVVIALAIMLITSFSSNPQVESGLKNEMMDNMAEAVEGNSSIL
jgi:hypothetical protein